MQNRLETNIGGCRSFRTTLLRQWVPRPVLMRFRSLRGVFGLVALALMVISVCGCRASGPFGVPGTINAQQRRAVVHDPFPQYDIGREELAARPREFQRTVSEPVRNRMKIEQDHLFPRR
ncbi:MAG: membrane or secreted protein [Planctomycetota bacterium]